MNVRKIFAPHGLRYAVSGAALLLLSLSGCKTTVDDPTLTTNIKAALAADPSTSRFKNRSRPAWSP